MAMMTVTSPKDSVAGKTGRTRRISGRHRTGAALCVAIGLLAVPVLAEDFNAAPPNARDQTPAFPGQTRAPEINDGVKLRTTIVARGLEHPWGMAELPDGSWLVTERPGRLRLVGADGTLSAPIKGVPAVLAQGQGGLLDVAVQKDFAATRRVWWTYAEPREGGRNGTAVATGILSPDGKELGGVKVIFRQQPGWASRGQFGSRLVFDGRGALFVTLGELQLPEPRKLAQDITTDLGKVVRIDPEGGPAKDNPKIAGALPEIWSWGHRNPQGAALDPEGRLWTVEHGPRGGDELNHPESGRNYGWPVITYGIDYSGWPIGDGITAKAGMEQPVYYWDPVIAPSGLAFYAGDLFPGWQGSALIGGLTSQYLVRLTLKEGKVTGEARYLHGIGRVRDVAVARDGAVMLLTDEADGALIRVTPEN